MCGEGGGGVVVYLRRLREKDTSSREKPVRTQGCVTVKKKIVKETTVVEPTLWQSLTTRTTDWPLGTAVTFSFFALVGKYKASLSEPVWPSGKALGW